jgi:hypothetical protein
MGITTRKSPRPFVLRDIQPPKRNSHEPWEGWPHLLVNAFLKCNVDVGHDERNFMVLRERNVRSSPSTAQVLAYLLSSINCQLLYLLVPRLPINLVS